MKLRDYIYNGHYNFFATRERTANPKKAAWGVCSIAATLYAFSGYAVFVVVANRYGSSFPVPASAPHIIIAVTAF